MSASGRNRLILPDTSDLSGGIAARSGRTILGARPCNRGSLRRSIAECTALLGFGVGSDFNPSRGVEVCFVTMSKSPCRTTEDMAENRS